MMRNKKFIFIDESGDLGVHENSSEYFAVGALVVDYESMKDLNRILSDFRYWRCFYPELKRINNPLQERIYETFNNIIFKKEHINFYYIKIDKNSFIQPFLNSIGKSELNTEKFRNLIFVTLLKNIEEIQNRNFGYEIIIDRYSNNAKTENELRIYIKNDSNLPNFESVSLVNSIYCEPIQIIDLVFRAIKNGKLEMDLINKIGSEEITVS